MLGRSLKSARRYYAWWVSTLQACFPAQVSAAFRQYKKQDELLIAHEGARVFIRDSSGHILKSINVVAEPSAPAEDYTLEVIRNEMPEIRPGESEHEHFDLGHMSSRSEKTQTQFDEEMHARRDITRSNLHNFGPIRASTGEDITLQIMREDTTQTELTELLDDDDTVVVNNGHASFDDNTNTDITGDETTLVFFNDQGRIRAVDNDQDDEVEKTQIVERTPQAQTMVSAAARAFDKAAGLAREFSGKKRCIYLLPENSYFTVQLTYPVQALENLDSVLLYDLEKHIPVSFDEIRYFYTLHRHSESNTVAVDLAVLKTTDFLALQSAFNAQGNGKVVCTSRYFYENFGAKIDFLADQSGANSLSLLSAKRFHSAFNFALFLAALAVPYYLYLTAETQLNVSGDKEVAQVKQLIADINDLNSELELGAKLSQELNNRARMVSLLNLLSEHIHTDAWITRFSYKNRELSIKGEAASATSVVDSLNATGRFENIKFVSSIIKNPNTKKESFELLMRVKEGA